MRPLLATATLTVQYVRMLAVLPSKIECRKKAKDQVSQYSITLNFIIHHSSFTIKIQPSTRPQTGVSELQYAIAGDVSARRT